MGTSSSVAVREEGTLTIIQQDDESMNEFESALSIETTAIANFPTSLPIKPNPNLRRRKMCRASWSKIGSQSRSDDCGFYTQGHTIFFRKFYEKIQKETAKSSLNFSCIKLKRISGATVATNCRFVDYMLSIADTQAEKPNFQILNSTHQIAGVGGSQYGVFVTIFLMQLSESLGSDSSESILDAWAHLCGFTIAGILSAPCESKVKY